MSDPGVNVVVDARIPSGEWGGVESVVIGLARGLSGLADSPDRYHFLTYPTQDGWLRPYLSGPSSNLPAEATAHRLISWRRSLARTTPILARAWRQRPARLAWAFPPPPSDGTAERVGADVVHFTFQAGFRTTIPSIYHPHDLQHIHLPEFFPAAERRRREVLYRAMCEQSAMVAVASRWTKRDVEQHYALPPDKVVVVPLAPPTGAYGRVDPEEAEANATRLGVPPTFVLYPAQTWPHKNHLALLEALATLRRGGLVVPFVSTGRLTEHFRVLQQRATRLGIDDQVYWLGFVPPRDLSALYSRATAVIIPTRFEAASAPLWEAFLAGVPAACSSVTSLPEQAGDAALLFDPDSTDQLAEAIRRLWEDPSLRSTLVIRGRERVASFTWDRTARLFRAHYRRLAGRTLDNVDLQLIADTTPI